MRDLDALIAWLDANRRTEFAWGTFDCVTAAAAAVKVQTGVDRLAAQIGRRWQTARGATRALNLAGGLEAATSRALTQLESPALALRGDVGLIEVEGRPSLVIFEGDQVVGPGLAGLVRLPRLAARAAWSAEG